MSIADTTDFGILRLIVDNPAQAESILKEDGFTVSQTDVIAIGLVDRPGQLAKALSVLQNAGVGVEYMYAFVSREDGTAAVIFRVENSALAEANLAKEGFEILSKEDVCKL